MTKICITSLGSDLDSLVDFRFGRAQFFLFLDEKGEIEETVKNAGVQATRGAGVLAAQTLIEKGVGILITGNIGPNALNVLQGTDIKVVSAEQGSTIKQAFDDYKKGNLLPLQSQGRARRGRGW